MWELRRSPEIVMKGFGNMLKLKCVMVVFQINKDYSCEHLKIDEVSLFLPNVLCFLLWDRYPHRSLPKTFRANNLVAFELNYSRIVQLWEGGERKVYGRLAFFILERYNKNIRKILFLVNERSLTSSDFLTSTIPNLMTLNLGLTSSLERLNLEGYDDLILLLAPVGCLKRLVYLNLSKCLSFESFLLDKLLKSFEVGSSTQLHLIMVPVDVCPLHPGNLPMFWYSIFYDEKLPSLIRNIQKLISLGHCSCTNLKSFTGSICGLRHLKELTLEGRIQVAPMDLDRLECLEELNLLCKCIKTLPHSICMLIHLKSLKLESCYQLEKLPEDFGHLECLEELTKLCTSIKHLPDSTCLMKNLKSLQLEFCWLLEWLPVDLGRLECLEKLHLLSSSIRHLPDNVCMLKQLKSLKLEICLRLEKLPEDLGQLVSLEHLILEECGSLKDIPTSICNMKRLKFFRLPYWVKVEKLPEELGSLECLEELEVEDTGIIHLPWSISSLNGLLVVGSRSLLQSCGFAIEIQTS